MATAGNRKLPIIYRAKNHTDKGLKMIPLDSIMFWVTSIILIAAACMVVTSRNPVHSVLFLILAFFNAAILFLLVGAEFLAMLLIVVYVGAVAVLFLFVVMMLDVAQESMKQVAKRHFPMAIIIGGLLFFELALAVSAYKFLPDEIQPTATNVQNLPENNTEALGNLLYTHYDLMFQLAGIILLLAMIGAITLTLRHRDGVKRQNISKQIDRNAKNEISMVSMGK